MKKIRVLTICVLILMLATAFASCARGNNMSQDELEAVFSGYTQWSLYNRDEGEKSAELATKFKDNAMLPAMFDDCNAEIVMLGEPVTLKSGISAELTAYRHHSSDTVMRFAMNIGEMEFRQSVDSSYVDPNYAYAIVLDSQLETPSDVLLVVNVGSVTQVSSLMYRNIMTYGIITEVRPNNVMEVIQRMNLVGTKNAAAKFIYVPQEYGGGFMKLSGMWELQAEGFTYVLLDDIFVTMLDEDGNETGEALPKDTKFMLTATDCEKVYFVLESGDKGYFNYSMTYRTIDGVNEADVIGRISEPDGELQPPQYR